MSEAGTVARPYARAIFELARAEDGLSAWSAALEAAARVVAHPDAKAFLSRRDVDNEARVSFLQAVCGAVADTWSSPRGNNLLRLLAENGRLSSLPEIASRFETLKAWAENRVKIRLVTASSVGESMVGKIENALERRMGRAVELELSEDPELLGGAVVHAEGRVIDGSVKSRLKELADALTA